ncbi:MAG: hypothetical protein Q4F17_02730 [Eubacteriales bacterium]|nr:hypothetical protein [Eubacteriales bacterium]
MKKITEYLHYLPAASEPLSADVFVITGEKQTYLFDVGRKAEAFQLLSELPGEKTVVLSHFHKDHTENLDRLTYKNLYVGDCTFEKLGKGTVVTDHLTIRDGVKLDIQSCPSPHTPGSLILTVNNEYTLLADLYFTRPDYDRHATRAMLEVLEKLDTKYFVVSHQEGSPVFEKAFLLEELKKYFRLS